MTTKKVKMARILFFFLIKLETNKNQKNQKLDKFYLLDPEEVLGKG